MPATRNLEPLGLDLQALVHRLWPLLVIALITLTSANWVFLRRLA